MSFATSGFFFCDGILSKHVSQKKSGTVVVHLVVTCGQTAPSYVIEKNGIYSHGKTIKGAKESLIFKIGYRDTTAYKRWTAATKITAAQAIASYRAITGACEMGVRQFCNGKDLDREYTVKEIVSMTNGAYGHESYREFFAGIK